MKLLRYGPRGAEKPGLLDAEGQETVAAALTVLERAEVELAANP